MSITILLLALPLLLLLWPVMLLTDHQRHCLLLGRAGRRHVGERLREVLRCVAAGGDVHPEPQHLLQTVGLGELTRRLPGLFGRPDSRRSTFPVRFVLLPGSASRLVPAGGGGGGGRLAEFGPVCHHHRVSPLLLL